MSQPKSSSVVRQIRALYDNDTITVYQAYNATIATAAVAAQRLDASPLFLPTRMTWVKPSWNWMMYRSGYAAKDSNQTCILALKLKRDYWDSLLARGVLSHAEDSKRHKGQVRVQWDPERSVRIGKVAEGNVRSIQVGIPGEIVPEWIQEGIVSIEDVTERARELRIVLDERVDVGIEELMGRDLIPKERVYELSEEVARVVRITN